jgi:D-sedoheptulose 7-phosphate isomerase
MAAAEEILRELSAHYPALGECLADIRAAFDLLVHSYERGGKLLICGNGGSAADAEHMSAELLKGFRSGRALGESWRKILPRETWEVLQGALPAIPLPSFVAFQTAFSNDRRPEFCFAQLVLALGAAGDVLFAISTSGNASNVLLANGVARAKGMAAIGLTGADGGKMPASCDVCIRVPERETYRIQELHLPVYHALCAMVEAHFFGGDGNGLDSGGKYPSLVDA